MSIIWRKTIGSAVEEYQQDLQRITLGAMYENACGTFYFTVQLCTPQKAQNIFDQFNIVMQHLA